MAHYLKTWPKQFKMVKDGNKKFEIRKCDRPFYVGDILILKEYCPKEGYTGDCLGVQVTHIINPNDIPKEYGFSISGCVIMSITKI